MALSSREQSANNILSGLQLLSTPPIIRAYNSSVNSSQTASDYNSAEAVASRNWSSNEALKTRIFNSEEARLQREWATEMSNTAYQRAVEDMKKAGLNPYLAYSQGGASVGSGATASSSVPSSTLAHAYNTSSAQNTTSLVGSALTFLGLALRTFK